MKNSPQRYQNLSPDELKTQTIAAYRAGRYPEAFELCCRCIEADPASDYSKMLLAHFCGDVSIESFSPLAKRAVLRCLQSPKVAHEKLQRRWRDLFLLDPAFASLREFMHSPLPVKTEPGWKSMQGAIMDPFLTEGLRMMVMTDPSFEKLFQKLRSWLLLDALDRDGLLRHRHLPFLSALAENCFLNEYAFACSPEEEQALAGLKSRLEKESAPDPVNLCIAGCYEALWRLPQASKLLGNQWPQPMQSLVRLQVEEPLQEEKIRKDIKTLSPVRGEVSGRVRAMYEENPYPRWRSIDLQPQQKRGITGHYLCAGCGTGHSLVQNAHLFSDLSFQAIDLSIHSLAYAARKAQDNGVANINFQQCDIMDMEALPGLFDVIESSGVLHHMENPVAGWKKLLGRLAPGGRMFIGLYSTQARQSITAAQVHIKEKGYPPTPAGIRAARQEVVSAPAFASLTLRHDFYTLSECRDLLFHVQEHSFTLPQIAGILEDLGLSFQGFQLPNPRLQQLYRDAFPSDPSLLDLEKWHEIEKRNPDLFIGMYVFLCCRKNEIYTASETFTQMYNTGFFRI
ncbi:MAG: class I SAM-dependent methyltransferase [Alphaproteobacteria bacterium]|nr:class I SAM-dependent methyltransferase [Alphaproteobacteria bacterium]